MIFQERGGFRMTKKVLIHAIATCHDCDWVEEDYNLAQKEGRKHALRTGHEVDIQTGYTQTYNLKGEESK